MEEPAYPAHWSADVLLRDGRPCHLRPITPDDAQRLRDFHASLSAETVYFRYFAPYPHLTERDVARFTQVDYVDRVALVAVTGDEIIGVGRYDRLNPTDAEVAFTIRDDHQGRGLGSVLLEHLSSAARERGIARFVADVLPQNRRMLATFEAAGYRPARELSDGYVSLEFDIEPTRATRAVSEERARRSEARSIRRLLTPRTIAVVGASRTPGNPGHELLRHVRDGGFAGAVVAVHPEAESILGFPCVRSVADVPGTVDLAVVMVRAERVLDIVDQCADAGVRGLVVVSEGFAETGSIEGVQRQRDLVEAAVGRGMRVVGPAALGVMNTDPRSQLNASLSAVMPPRGRLGFFCQTGGLGSVILADLAARGLGVSTFMSAGNRSDVSGNDLLQYWDEDPATDAVLLYLESVGNPRRFSRIVRRLARRKPVLAVRSGRTSQSVPLGHRVGSTALPPAAVDELFDQCGVVQTESVRALLDVASIVATQPPPASGQVSVLSSAQALAVLAEDAVRAEGLRVGPGAVLPTPLSAEDVAAAVRGAAAAPGIGSVLLVHVPPLAGDLQPLREGLLEAARDLTVPIVAVSLPEAGDVVDRPGWHVTAHGPWIGGRPGAGAATPGAVPLFGAVLEAVHALALVTRRTRWLTRQTSEPVVLEDADAAAAEAACAALRGDSDDSVTVPLDAAGLAVLGIRAPGDQEGGVACRIEVVTDPLFGPVVSFGLEGEIPDLLGDRAYASPPLTEVEAAALVRAPRTAALIDDGDLAGLADLVTAVAAAADAVVLLEGLELHVLAGPNGARITRALLTVAARGASADRDRRTL